VKSTPVAAASEPSFQAKLRAILSNERPALLEEAGIWVRAGCVQRPARSPRPGVVVAKLQWGRSTSKFMVTFDGSAENTRFAYCTCGDFARHRVCVHACAVALTLVTAPGTAVPAPVVEEKLLLPPPLKQVDKAAVFFQRLHVFVGEPLPSVESWLTLTEWWNRTVGTNKQAEDGRLLRTHVANLASAIAADLQTLKRWEPPLRADDGTTFGQVYTKLRARYLAC
jgi:hypothetical protein